jgi:pimeloyl-ACP methyl ester carboxylesterase
MKYLFTLFLFSLHLTAWTQPVTPADWGLKRFTLADKKNGPIGFYVDTTNIKQKAPLLIFLQGSGGYPMMFYVEGDSFAYTTSTFDVNLLSRMTKDFHFVMIDKPGLHFCDTIKSNERDPYKLMRNYTPPAYYTETLSLGWRVKSASAVITYLIKNKYFDNSKIIVWGYSEGGQVVPKIASEDKRVTHVVSVVGSGLNQFYDNLMSTRMKVVKGEYTHQEAQSEIDSYLYTFREIYKNPEATDKTFNGHTYKRWASFCAEDPYRILAQLTIPVYMLAGSADNNSPVYGLDYVPLEFARLKKNNLTYEVCVGCDHFQTIIESGDETLKGKNVGAEYREKILRWINTH